MLAYKNHPGKLIIVYDNSEKVAPVVTSTLVQRGYENVHMLSGGLKMAFQKYPHGLITGIIPPEFIQIPKPKTKRIGLNRSVSMPPTK